MEGQPAQYGLMPGKTIVDLLFVFSSKDNDLFDRKCAQASAGLSIDALHWDYSRLASAPIKATASPSSPLVTPEILTEGASPLVTPVPK